MARKASFAQFGNDLYTGARSIDFVSRRRRRIWYSIGLLAVLLSLGALWLKGLNPGIEFRGGSEFRLTGVEDRNSLIAQDTIHDVVAGVEVRVSTVGSDSLRVQTNKLSQQQTDDARKALATAYDVPAANVTSSFVGPTWGADVSRKAFTGLLVFMGLVGVVITLYFRTWKMAVAALVALLHDLVVTVGVYALIGFEVTPASVIGFLTILGYSLYDTVVVFDKIRENSEHILATTKHTYPEAANLGVNQTLVRSINTSVVALLPVGSILFIGAFVLGAGTLKDLSLALFVGIAAGTYSSVFIAPALLVHLREREPELVAQAKRVLRRRSTGDSGPAPRGKVPVAAAAAVGAVAATSGGGATTAGGGTNGRGSGGAQRVQPRKGGKGGKGKNRPHGKRR